MWINQELTNYKICLFYPHRQRISGGLQYFYGIANYLASNSNLETYVLNYKDSYINSLFSWSDKLKIINYEDDNKELDNNTIFLVYSNMLPLFLEKFHFLNKAKIVLIDFHLAGWNILFNNLDIAKNIKEQQKIFQMLYEAKGVVFMDYSCWVNTQKRSNINFIKKYLPAFTLNEVQEDWRKNIDRKIKQDNIIDIAYVARLDNDKIWQAINLLDNLYLTQSNKKVRVHIIGDGNSKSLINVAHYNQRLEVILCGYIVRDKLNEYLIRNIDLCVAVGMAALDIAKLKIPTVLQYYNEKKFLDNDFFYLFECKEGILGGRKETIQELNIVTKSISLVINEIIEDRENIGKKCYEYAIKYHSLENSSKLFLEAALETQLTVEKCLKIDSCKTFVKDLSALKKIGYDANDYLKFKKEKFTNSLFVKMIARKVKLFFQRRCNEKSLTLNNDKKTIYKLFNFFAFFKIFESHKRKLFCLHVPLLNIDMPILKEVFNKEYTLLKLFAIIPLYKKHIKMENKYNNIQAHYEFVRQDIKKAVLMGGKIRVGFLIVEVSQYDSLIYSMENSELFDVTVVVIPDIARKDRMHEVMHIAYDNFSKKFRNVVMGYNQERDEYLDYSNDFDLVFFSNPYETMVHKNHFIWNFLNKNVLTCFQNYGFFTLIYGRTHIAQTQFFNSCWKVFVDSFENYQDLLKYQPLKAKNAFVAGYCKMDDIESFKKHESTRKKILLCPHHTINMKALAISNFMRYSDLFLELPRKYPKIDFIFRPHLLLFWTLKQIWGDQAVKQYLQKMQSYSNVFYDDNKDFKQSFADSDAIIHDCGSFTAEYLFMNKPACYMLKNKEQIQKDFLPIGQLCLEHYYKAYTEEDICKFIEEVVIAENDVLKEKRKEFSKKLKLNHPNVGKGIMYYIKEEIMR